MKLIEFLAIYGASLSTVVFFWNFIHSRPKYKVRALVSGDEADPTRFAGAQILVQNKSTKVVHKSEITVFYPYKAARALDQIKDVARFRRLPLRVGWVGVCLRDYGIKDGCPIALEPGQVHQVFVPRELFNELLDRSLRREIRAFAKDRFWGNEEYSNLIRVPSFNDGKSSTAHN